MVWIGEIAKKKCRAVTYRGVTVFGLLACVAQPSWYNRYLCMPISLRQFCHLDESGPEGKKGVEVGFGRGVRIDIGIALRKHGEDFTGAEQPNCGQGYLSQILPGLKGSICPLLAFLMLAKLFAAQNDGPVRQRTGELYHSAQAP